MGELVQCMNIIMSSTCSWNRSTIAYTVRNSQVLDTLESKE